MDAEESPFPSRHVGARLGNKVTVHKLERTDAKGRKVRTHPRYNWRCSYVENGKRASKYFKTRTSAEEWAAKRETEALAHGTTLPSPPWSARWSLKPAQLSWISE